MEDCITHYVVVNTTEVVTGWFSVSSEHDEDISKALRRKHLQNVWFQADILNDFGAHSAIWKAAMSTSSLSWA
jgi:hypothetical protein